MRPFLLHHTAGTTAKRTPFAVALEFTVGHATKKMVTYRELDGAATSLAEELRRLGVGRHDRIGVCLPKCYEAYVTILAVLKVGATYVPLDRSAPAARLFYLIDQCKMKALVIARDVWSALPEPHEGFAMPHTIVVGVVGAVGADADNREGALNRPGALPFPQNFLRVAPEPIKPATPPSQTIDADLAYILFTSGSTGVPKGVMHTHRSAMAFVDWSLEAIPLRSDDRVAGVAELHFDLSILDVFSTWKAGATLVPVPPQAALRPKVLSNWIREQRISVWYSTPSLLMTLLHLGDLAEHAYPDLRLVLFAGEVFPTKALRKLREVMKNARLYNLYGPTETNVCTYHEVQTIPTRDDETIPIGRACANVDVALRDGEGRIVANEGTGELWVRGASVMAGYWRSPSQTSSAIPASAEDFAWESNWYRTGDTVHRDETGALHFRGRTDNMIKVRGYRVDLEEIEAVLRGHSLVKEVGVVGVPAKDIGVKVQACIVLESTDAATDQATADLQRYAAERLPLYMIPSDIVYMSRLPTTSTGKVDRQRLAKPGV